MSSWQQLASEFGGGLGGAVDVSAQAESLDVEVAGEPPLLLSQRRVPGPEPERPPAPVIDSYPTYTQLRLPDGRVLRRYDTGSVRTENPKSGVIQEERADGSLLVSLPSARLILQECPGEPVLLFDLETGAPAGLVRVGMLQLPGEETARPVFHFRDSEGEHMVELESLRYFRVRRAAAA